MKSSAVCNASGQEMHQLWSLSATQKNHIIWYLKHLWNLESIFFPVGNMAKSELCSFLLTRPSSWVFWDWRRIMLWDGRKQLFSGFLFDCHALRCMFPCLQHCFWHGVHFSWCFGYPVFFLEASARSPPPVSNHLTELVLKCRKPRAVNFLI